MPRGVSSNVGDERTSPNGYRYVRTESGWKLLHRVIAEEKLGRELNGNEYVAFKDNDRTNLEPENIEVRQRGRSSLRRRLALVNSRLQDLAGVKEDLETRLEIQENL